MRIRPLVNAGVVIETPDCRLVVDPWLSDSCHYNSWAPWPRIPNLIEKVGPVDLIFVSHIHADHADVWSLNELQRRNNHPVTIIADFQQAHLARLLERKIRLYSIRETLTRGETVIRTFASNTHANDVDSVIAVKHGNQSVVCWGDTPVSDDLIARVRAFVPDLTCAMLPFTGAGPWPQTYLDIGSTALHDAMAWKRANGVKKYEAIRMALKPKVSIPYAGAYMLTGRLAYLNPFRGMMDAADILHHDGDAVVLADGGEAFLDLDTLTPSAVRTEPYSDAELSRASLALSTRLFDYEKEHPAVSISFAPIDAAFNRAATHSECVTDHWYCIQMMDGWIVANTHPEGGVRICLELPDVAPRTEIYIDSRALMGALTGKYHWSNLAGGSHFFSRRFPDVYDRATDDWLNWFFA